MSKHDWPYENPNEDDEDPYEYEKERQAYEWEKNKHLYKDKSRWNEPYERLQGEGRGVFPEHFPEESFEAYEEFDQEHKWPEIGREQEYYENFIREIGKVKDNLVHEYDMLKEEYDELVEIHSKKYDIEKKKSSPFIPVVEGKDEIIDLYNQIELIKYKQGILEERFFEAARCGQLDDLKEKEPYWAERYERELENIRKGEVREKEIKKEFYERGEEYFSSEQDARSKRFGMGTKIDMAKEGLTPDAIGEVTGDYDGATESGDDYFRAKENLTDDLGKITYEKALEKLNEGREEGKYSDERYYQLQGLIRRHYGV